MTRSPWLVLLLILCHACAPEERAVLEVGLQLTSPLTEALSSAGPRDEATHSFLFVQFRPASSAWPFEDAWPADPRDPLPVPLYDLEGCQEVVDGMCRVAFSVLSATEVTGLRVKVRLCGGPSAEQARCQEQDETFETLARYFEIDHPFYLGQRTWWGTTIERFEGPLPAEEISPQRVDRCEVAGCTEEAGWPWSDSSSNYCSTSNGRHFCEDTM